MRRENDGEGTVNTNLREMVENCFRNTLYSLCCELVEA
jgi:hypothetical protein